MSSPRVNFEMLSLLFFDQKNLYCPVVDNKISNETIKTTLSSTETVREVRRVSIEDQTTANTSEKEEENHTP